LSARAATYQMEATPQSNEYAGQQPDNSETTAGRDQV
jgi:hypothetical protein